MKLIQGAVQAYKYLFGFNSLSALDYGPDGAYFMPRTNMDLATEWAQWAAIQRQSNRAVLIETSLDLNGIYVLNLYNYGLFEAVAAMFFYRGDLFHFRTDESKKVISLRNDLLEEIERADVIIGPRVDDTYLKIFKHVFDPNSAMSLTAYYKSLLAGNLGPQIFLNSSCAFENLKVENIKTFDVKNDFAFLYLEKIRDIEDFVNSVILKFPSTSAQDTPSYAFLHGIIKDSIFNDFKDDLKKDVNTWSFLNETNNELEARSQKVYYANDKLIAPKSYIPPSITAPTAAFFMGFSRWIEGRKNNEILQDDNRVDLGVKLCRACIADYEYRFCKPMPEEKIFAAIEYYCKRFDIDEASYLEMVNDVAQKMKEFVDNADEFVSIVEYELEAMYASMSSNEIRALL